MKTRFLCGSLRPVYSWHTCLHTNTHKIKGEFNVTVYSITVYSILQSLEEHRVQVVNNQYQQLGIYINPHQAAYW